MKLLKIAVVLITLYRVDDAGPVLDTLPYVVQSFVVYQVELITTKNTFTRKSQNNSFF